jgi:hypothetical protein
MYYEERVDGEWQRLSISGEMLMGRAHHAIYFASVSQWNAYPAWARDRRDEIIARIKSEFRAPDYEYYEPERASDTSSPDGSASAAAPAPNVVHSASASAPTTAAAARHYPPTTPQQFRALNVAIALVFAIAAIMTWLVVQGVRSGESVYPSKRPSLGRAVSRDREPAMYWMSIGVYAAIGGATLGLGVWGIREGRALRRKESRATTRHTEPTPR